MSQFQFRKKIKTLFQFMKNTKWHFGYTDLKSIFKHGTAIQTGITCKKIHSYMRDSHRWFIVKKAQSYVRHF